MADRRTAISPGPFAPAAADVKRVALESENAAASNESSSTVSHRRVQFRIRLILLFLAAGLVSSLPAETLAERTLKEIVMRQRVLFERAEKDGDDLDEAFFSGEAKSIAGSYDVLIQKNPEFAAGYVAYGMFLGKIDMNREAAAMLLRANQLDSKIAVVKNQMAKLLAEDGKPLEALSWITAAIDLEPEEPLYHYQLGLLLMGARDDFIKSGDFTSAGLDRTMLNAYTKAVELAPKDLSIAYQQAKAYYVIDPPRWEEALQLWTQLEEKPVTNSMRQLIRLQKSNILLKLGRNDEARQILDRVTDLQLTQEKQTLLDQLAPKAEK
jgi:tetratricopeptide (TPR) repeat protein